MVKAVKENRIYEAFGAGTAAIVSPVKSFNFDGEVYQIPIEEEKGAEDAGEKEVAGEGI